MECQILSSGRRIKSDLSMTAGMTNKELEQLLKNLKWIKQEKQLTDDLNDDGETNFLKSCYSGITTYGSTDYKDHRGDDLVVLKKLITESLKQGGQRLNFYKDNGEMVNTIIVRGYLGGYTGQFKY